MFKLFLHPTEKPSEERKTKAFPLLIEFLENSPIIRKEFLTEEQIDNLPDKEYDEYFSSETDNPDLLVKKKQTGSKSLGDGIIIDEWWNEDHCAFEFKFGMDLVNSLNSHTLEDELTRMKRKYSKHEDRFYDTYDYSIPLYLIIVNEWIPETFDRDGYYAIDLIDLSRAYTIAQDLNIRVKYTSDPINFAEKVFDLIRTPPKPVDLGQRFVIKSSGSVFNRQLQLEPGITRAIADKIEEWFTSWHGLIWHEKNMPSWTPATFKECFTTDSGRFMRANMEKFLRKVSGGDGK